MARKGAAVTAMRKICGAPNSNGRRGGVANAVNARAIENAVPTRANTTLVYTSVRASHINSEPKNPANPTATEA